MKLPVQIAILLSSAFLFTGCAGPNGAAPDIQTVQPSKQDMETAKMDRAIYQ